MGFFRQLVGGPDAVYIDRVAEAAQAVLQPGIHFVRIRQLTLRSKVVKLVFHRSILVVISGGASWKAPSAAVQQVHELCGLQIGFAAGAYGCGAEKRVSVAVQQSGLAQYGSSS